MRRCIYYFANHNYLQYYYNSIINPHHVRRTIFRYPYRVIIGLYNYLVEFLSNKKECNIKTCIMSVYVDLLSQISRFYTQEA